MAVIEEGRDSKHLFKHLSPPTSPTILRKTVSCVKMENMKMKMCDVGGGGGTSNKIKLS